MSDVRALTLHQPWASLVACGRKRVETRSWRTDYRGPLLVHAAARVPINGECPGTLGYDLLGNLIYWLPEPWTEEEQVAVGYTPDGNLHGFPLPLGAVVASCQLVDVVPIVSWSPLDGPPAWAAHMIPVEGAGPDIRRMILVRDADAAAECLRDDGPLPAEVDATPQLPFGDFTPGRWAWLLDDIKATTERCPRCWGRGWTDTADGVHSVACPTCERAGFCEPVPMRGRQGLFRPTWDESLSHTQEAK